MREKRLWQLSIADNSIVDKLAGQLGVSRVMARILVSRDFLSPEEVRSFLYKDLKDLEDPLEIPGMKKGAERIKAAVGRGEQILVYGDYDVDGITAAALLTDFLRKLGANADYYIPDRMEEGYGLNKQAILQAKEKGTNLLVSVDCGISSHQETAFAAELGIDVVITDHHQPPADLPEAKAIINPKLAQPHRPWYELAGVGVAFKLGQALAKMFGYKGFFEEYLDLTALGTIADIVPLRDENRILVKEGLPFLRQMKRWGLAALLEVSGLKDKKISTEQISFILAPRLNACGRLGRAELGVELLLTSDEAFARETALTLNKENQTRQALEAEIMKEALLQLETQNGLSKGKILVLFSENWHPGVIGIVASKLTDKYYRPTVMISLEDEIGKGSARSIPGFNLYSALEHVKEYLLNFGGHEQAAGLSVRKDMIPELKKHLNEYADKMLDEKSFVPILKVDTEISWQELNENLVKELDLLAPFGYHNPYPLLALRRQQITDCREVGAGGGHLKLKVVGENSRLDGIAFQKGAMKELAATWDKCDLAFMPEMNSYNGYSRLQLNIRDIKPYQEPDDPFVPQSFLDKLYLEGEIWLEDSFYRDIIEREEFYTKVVGVTFENRQETIRLIQDGEVVELRREPQNEFDPYALSVNYEGVCIGYLNNRLARWISPTFDSGTFYQAYVSQITGREKEIMGVNLCIYKAGSGKEDEELDKIKTKLRNLPESELKEEIRKAVLGHHEYHSKQNEALQYLETGQNSLVILATGRGKSAVFQSMAAYLALVKKKTTIIVYPLRSLVNDQNQHLKRKLAKMGISIAAINGSMNMQEKKEFFIKLMQGNIDIVLTTPEFLEYHMEKFKCAAERLGLFVVDEAHHLGRGKRRGYRLLAKNWRGLGKPLSLAVTATADEETAQRIIDAVESKQIIIENHMRSNLLLADKREEKDKLAYLVNLISLGERVVIYVNSRKQAYRLAGDLRLYYPPARNEIAFYHGGLHSEYRNTLENMFREGSLRVMVTTSAFGEGIDIPDIKHVVLYHLCFSYTEFNQLAGRAGRNNEDAYIHIVFGEKDKKLNELILESVTPSREVLGKVYLYLRDQALVSNPLQVTNHEISEAMQQAGFENFREQTASACLAVLEELGLILRETEGSRRYIHFAPPPPGKLELTDSVRYLEGWDEWEEFQDFAGYVLKQDTSTILGSINKPIYPINQLTVK